MKQSTRDRPTCWIVLWQSTAGPAALLSFGERHFRAVAPQQVGSSVHLPADP